MTNEERKAALEAIIYAADEPATIEQAKPFRQFAHPDIFGDIDTRDNLGLLVDHPDPGFVCLAGIIKRERPSIDRERPDVRLVIAVDDLQKG